MDSGPVTMLTTVHDIGEHWQVLSLRRRPRETCANAAKIRKVFDDQHVKELKIPKMVDDYNKYMGGVDLADQYRSYYPTQLKVFRNGYRFSSG